MILVWIMWCFCIIFHKHTVNRQLKLGWILLEPLVGVLTVLKYQILNCYIQEFIISWLLVILLISFWSLFNAEVNNTLSSFLKWHKFYENWNWNWVTKGNIWIVMCKWSRWPPIGSFTMEDYVINHSLHLHWSRFPW